MSQVKEHRWVQAALALFVGIALGLFSHASSSLPGAWPWLGNFGALWVAVSFAVGYLAKHTRWAAPQGAVMLSVASLVHYVPFRFAREGITWQAFRWPVLLWITMGLVVGALFGVLGAAYRLRLRNLSAPAVATLAATFAGEAIVLARTGHPSAVRVAVPIEMAIAILIPYLLASTWADRAKVTLVAILLLPVVVLAFSTFMGVIHRVYPGV